MLSRVVNTLISIKPIYSIMKIAAKQVLVDTANKNGIPWKETVRELQSNPEVLAHSSSQMLGVFRQKTFPLAKALQGGRVACNGCCRCRYMH